MYHIAIVDDEDTFIEQIHQYIDRYEKEEDVLIKVTTFRDGEELLKDYEFSFDLILMDIEMPKMNGMDAARVIRQRDEGVVIVFITNMASYAIHGYEVGALDFVMKPITYPAFSMRLTRALKRVIGRKQEQVLLKLSDGLKPIELSEIYYVEVQGHTLTYHTSEGNFTIRGTMASVVEQMAPYSFAKCNNYCLVNLSHVTKVQGMEVVVGDDGIPMSRRNKTSFLQELAEYVGGTV